MVFNTHFTLTGFLSENTSENTDMYPTMQFCQLAFHFADEEVVFSSDYPFLLQTPHVTCPDVPYGILTSKNNILRAWWATEEGRVKDPVHEFYG